MKAMKCPHCQKKSTFNQTWLETIPFCAPVIIDGDDKTQVDYEENNRV